MKKKLSFLTILIYVLSLLFTPVALATTPNFNIPSHITGSALVPQLNANFQAVNWQNPISFSGDFHNQNTAGYYQTSAAGQANAPNIIDNFDLTVYVIGSKISQYAVDVSTGTGYWETYNGSTWSSWTQLANTSSNITGTASNVTGTVAVANGGTGATTSSGALSNLGAANSGINSNITSLIGLTIALPLTEGGTGATTSSTALANLGATSSAMLAATGTGNGANLVGFLQAGTGAVATTSQVKLQQMVSIYDFMTAAQIADAQAGTTSLDDTSAIQAALNYAGTVYGTVVIPIGKYKTTSTLTVPDGVNIQGQGWGSALYPQSCDGLTFATSTMIGPRYFRDFQIWGNNDYSNNGISVPGDANGDRDTGLIFEDIYIAFYGTGVNSRALWHSQFDRVTLNNCYNGFVIRGQNVKVLIHDCSVLKGTATGTGSAIGINVEQTNDYNPGGTTSHRPEDIQIDHTIVYSYDYGVQWNQCLYGSITNSDLDYNTTCGIYLQQQDGGVVIRDNWIALNSSTEAYGIQCVDQGSAQFDRLLIDHNTIQTYDAASSNAIGIYVGANHYYVTVSNNDITGFKKYDIDLNYCGRVTVVDNQCSDTSGYSIYVISTLDHINIDRNTIFSIMYVHPTANNRVTIGETYGTAQSTYIRGATTIAAGTTSATTTFASLNGAPPNFSSSGSYIQPSITIEAPSTNIGNVWATVTDSQVTINCSTAAPAGGTTVYWVVRGKQSLN